jgi:hypothetical protein
LLILSLCKKSLPALGENHQNNITLSSGLIASFALELACNTQTAPLVPQNRQAG